MGSVSSEEEFYIFIVIIINRERVEGQENVVVGIGRDVDGGESVSGPSDGDIVEEVVRATT